MVSQDLYCQNKSTSKEAILQQLLIESEENWHSDILKAQKLAKKAFLMLDDETLPYLRAEAYTQYGVSFYTDLNYDSAIYYYEKATKVAIDHNLEVYKYLATTTSAMEKTGRFMNVINMMDKRISQVETTSIELFNLLMFKLSASISIGLKDKSDSIIQVAERLTLDIESEENIQRLKKLKGRYYHLIAQYEKSDFNFY